MFHVERERVVRRWARGVLLLVLAAGALAVLAPDVSAPLGRPALVAASDADPLPPTNVVITPGNGEFTRVSWTPSTEPNRSGYVVRLGSYSTTVFGANATSTTAAITGLTNGTDYTVEVYTRTSYNLLGLQTGTGTVPATATSYPRDGVAPARPTGVTVVRGDGQVTVSWAANTEPDLAGYRVLRDGAVVSGTLTARTFVDTGLVNDTTYRYAVEAVDVSRQWSNPSVPQVSATPTDLTPPGTPTMLLAERGDGQVTLSWAANPEPDVASYRLLRDGVEVATIPVSSRGYTDTGLVNDRTYRYSLVAVDTHGNRSTPTAQINATPTDLTPPAVPTGLSAARGDGRVDLTWTANGEPDLDTYRVLRDGVEIATVPRGTTSYADTGLVNDRTYAYRLVAVDTHVNRSAPSAAVDATPTDLTPPAAPTGLVAVRGDGRVDLSWTANGEPDLAGYRVLRDGVEVGAATGTTYTDTGLVNDRSYVYRVVAVDTHGNRSAPSDPVGATPTDLTPPAAPTGLTAVRGDGQVALSWPSNPETDVAAYRVLRDDVEVATVTGASYTDTGLVNDRTYAYRLVAVDTHGNRSTASDPAVPATPTDLTPPAAPAGLVATRGDGQVVLTWTANTEPDLASYRVLRDGTEIATVTGTTYTVTGLPNDQPTSFSLVAVDTHGNRSTASAPAGATPTDLTAPAAPTGVATDRGDGQVTVSWAPVADPDVAGYRVLRDGVEVATVTGTSWTDTGLTNDTVYRYTVVAVDGHGNVSGPSAAVDGTPTDLTAPGVPVSPAATAGEREVTVSWTAPADPDVVGYRVLRDGAVVAATTGTSATVTGLAPGTAVDLVVVAVDGHGNVSAVSATVTATPYDRTAPAAPTGLAGRPASTVVTLTWTAPADVDPLTYRVLRDGVQVATTGATTATVTGLTNGTSYSFTVQAVDPSGNVSVVSAAVVVVPLAGTVPAQGSGETGALAVSSDGRYVVTGTRARLEPSDTNSAYELYRLDRVAGTATRIAPLAASATAADATNSAAPAISDDGRYVALATTAALVAADTNGRADVYRLDTRTGTWTLVSVPANGRVNASVAGTVLQTSSSVYATGPSVVISGDGDLVLFYSARNDLGPTDGNGVVDVYAKRLSTGAVTRVSATAAGGELTRQAAGPALAITPDGRYALFPATGSSGPVVLYRTTLTGGADPVVVSTFGATPVAVARDLGDVDLSDDGRYVVFATSAKPTAPTSSWSTQLAYRKDTVTGAVAALGDGQTSAWEHQLGLDPTGRYAFFTTTAALTPGDTNGHTDTFRRDLATGVLTLVTADADGRPVGGPTGAVAPAEYGRVVPVTGDLVVLTTSQALLPADTNRLRDLYVKDLAGGAVQSPVPG
ncbi:fibronectin type 3 domain-containing protein [Klenkia taihuensis]|uniref:Fibronectin type 3 domain-containing protein n=1 Tax=Klenkia taihuensis TaxID=1225127 RepID=A0A1I1H7R2_9ACTN|nr:fibronectin type 3 domain-containing protein [Klenkia taihuensis]